MSYWNNLEVWDTEIPANFDVWQILNTKTMNVPEKDHIIFMGEMLINKEINKEPANWVDQVEMIGETGEPMNWVDQVEKLWEAGELAVTSEWKPGDKEFKSSGCPHPKCIKNKSRQGKKAFNCHIITTNLPWFAYLQNVCWQCHQPAHQTKRFDHHFKKEGCFSGEFRDAYFQEWVGLVNQMLQFILEKLKLPAVSSLLEFITADPALCPKNNKTFQVDLQQLMWEFEQANGIDHQSTDYQMSPPNCIAALLHWITLFNLILLLDEEDQQNIQNFNTICNLLGEPLFCDVVQDNADEQSTSLDFTSTPKIADTHLHLDLMFQQMQVTSWEDAAMKFYHPDEEIPLEVIIPCYTFLSMYPHQSNLMKLPPLTQNVQIGFYPRSAAREFPHLFPKFQRLARFPQVAAIGEIGLDYTRGISSHAIQKQCQLFRLSIQVAISLNKLIVIHCRGRKNCDNCDATDDCIKILQHSLCDPYYPIYVHCFTGGISDYIKWVQAFPACMFGFTGALFNSRKHHPELLQVVASMDLGRILLIPPKYWTKVIQHSNPLMIVNIAKEVARLQHLPTTTIINMEHHNTLCFFCLTHQ